MSSTSSKVMGILALVSFLCLAALVALQALESMHYSADPTVWRETASY